MEGFCQAPPRFPPGTELQTPPARPAVPRAVRAGPHSPHGAVGPGAQRVEGCVSPGQLPERVVHLLSVKASSPCDVHRPTGVGQPPPQSSGFREGFWGESGAGKFPALVKKRSSKFPSLFSAGASVKGHVFEPSSLRLHIDRGEASGFLTRLGVVQVPLGSAAAGEHPAPLGHASGSPCHAQLPLCSSISREISSRGSDRGS